MDRSFQDVQLYMNYRCTGACTSGVLLRGQKTSDGGMNGVYASLTDGDTASYFVTLDAQGKEVARERLAAPAGRGGGGGNPGRGAAPPGTGGTAPAARGAEGAGGAAGPPAQPTPAPAAAAGQPSALPPPPGQQTGASGGRPPALKPGEWNPVYILLSAATLRPSYGGVGALDEKSANGYGPVAIFVGGSGEVRYKDVAWKNLNSIVGPAETTPAYYMMERDSSKEPLEP